MSKELTPVQQQAVELRDYLNADRIKSQIVSALPKWLSPDRFLRVIFGAALRNPKLMECSMESILQSVMMCAQLGLEPILGRAYLVPYWNGKKRCMEAQFQPGYQGLTDLARRSGMIKDVYAQVVYQNDHFEIEYGTGRKLVHKPTIQGEPGPAIGAYCVWEFKDGTSTFEFMPLHEINKRRNKSQSFNYAETGDPAKGGGKRDSVWHEWPEDMMRKTVVKHSSKLVPSSIEFMEAVMVDDAAETGRRVNMVQGVPMIEQGLGNQYSEDQDEIVKISEELSAQSHWVEKEVGKPILDDFVKATMTANRCGRNDVVRAANENPDKFIAAMKAWMVKNNRTEAQPPKPSSPPPPRQPDMFPEQEPEPPTPPEAPKQQPNVRLASEPQLKRLRGRCKDILGDWALVGRFVAFELNELGMDRWTADGIKPYIGDDDTFLKQAIANWQMVTKTENSDTHE